MRIDRVTTKAGDGGETRLGGGQKVPKDCLRVDAYGTVDELNSLLGLALAEGLHPEVAPLVDRVQNDLFRLGSDLCVLEEDKSRLPVLRVEEVHVARLEEDLAVILPKLPPLEEFILPGGSRGAACLHVARTVCRRAERLVVALSHREPIGPCTIRYLNRLSDWLFVLARHENRSGGGREAPWVR